MEKPKDKITLRELLPELPDYNPEPADGVRVGESPVPGLKLRRVLRGHISIISRIAWSPDGRFLASPSNDHSIRIWEVAQGECSAILEGHTAPVYSVTWSPDGSKLASGSTDGQIYIWATGTWTILKVLKEHVNGVLSVAWSPEGNRLASASEDCTIRIWDIKSYQTLLILESHTRRVMCVAWSPDGHNLASCSDDHKVCVWNAESGKEELRLTYHTSWLRSVAWAPNKPILVSGGDDKTIRLWDLEKNMPVGALEGHTSVVRSLSFSSEGNLMASKSADKSIILWRTDFWTPIYVLHETDTGNLASPAFHPHLPILATLGENDSVIRIWELDMDLLLNQKSTDSVHYTTAKLVLVGDSGVGKTGLGWRLAHGEFKEHASTHGQQFWVVDDLCTTRADGTECEAVLWDLAGQHIYRPIHAIFLDDVDASLVLFDPTNRQDPLKGAEFWLEQLAHKKNLPPSVLVGARLDRGAAVLSKDDLTQFCQKHGISGGYIGTSAKEGLGLEELMDILKKQIPWEQMTTTVTTKTFKKVKDYVLSLKEKTDRKGVLVSPAELRQLLEASDPEWEFSDAEMMTATGHLQTHGYVSILRSSSGEEHILLSPELLVDLASSIVLLADKHPRELGALSETELLNGQYPLNELNGLEKKEQQILLDAAVTRFLEHNICFRETIGDDTLLIFPSLIKQKRPLQDVEAMDDISYIVRGRVENIYPALVVLLGFTRTFTRVNQWQRQAQYEMKDGNICGFRLIEDLEGEIELVLYYSELMPDYGRRKFQGLFEEFLYQRDVEVTPFPPVFCPKNHLQERSTVVKRLREGKEFLFCEECGEKIDLAGKEKEQTTENPEQNWIQQEEALARLRSTYETHLTRIKAYRRDRKSPRCYISHLPAQANWVKRLTGDLRDAGVHVLSKPEELAADDLVLIADTLTYQQQFKNTAEVIAADAEIIRSRLEAGKKSTIFQLQLEGGQEVSGEILPGDFRRDSHYAVSLYDLVLRLYAIPYEHQAFLPFRKALRRQWEETLSRLPEFEEPVENPVRLFISYAHEDEIFKDDLVNMLSGMQRRGVIDAWQDRRIEPGEEWEQAIQTAMNECELALLLVSKHFLASRFIQNKEIPHLLQRRQDAGLRVVPVIVRPCPWTSEPVLKSLQALPTDGKAVITFLEETGDRDQAWTDIAKAIEKQAKALRDQK